MIGQGPLFADPGLKPDEPLAPKSLPTSRRGLEILQQTDPQIRVPTATERKALLVGFAMRGKVLYGAAYDAIRSAHGLALEDPEQIARHFSELTIIEVKSTNRAAVGDDLRGYFFNLTTAELLVAQTLGDQYKFAFVNVATGTHQELDLATIYSKARAIYPAWHIRF